jgi:hypothetical protein
VRVCDKLLLKSKVHSSKYVIDDDNGCWRSIITNEKWTKSKRSWPMSVLPVLILSLQVSLFLLSLLNLSNGINAGNFGEMKYEMLLWTVSPHESSTLIIEKKKIKKSRL